MNNSDVERAEGYNKNNKFNAFACWARSRTRREPRVTGEIEISPGK